jgi:hypothetical protein
VRGEGRKPLGGRKQRDYFCAVVSEGVKIALKNKAPISRELKRALFVQCNQLECQYVDLNQAPCPLSLDLFAEVIKKRGTNEDIEEWSPA